jgi:extradiol dioxygenase family protein
VDGEEVPAAHFGVILPWMDLDALIGRLRELGVPFVIEPTVRFAGRRGEQQTCFIRDPAGNHLEFKAFRNLSMLFATDGLDYP